MRYSVVTATVVLLCGAALAHAAPSNLELATRATSEAVSRLLESLPQHTGSVSVDAGDSPAAPVVEAVLAESLSVQGFTVVADSVATVSYTHLRAHET